MSAAAEHTGYRGLGRGTPAGVLLTLLVHGAIFGLAYMSQVNATPRPEAERYLIVTQLVRLGKPREKTQLPRVVKEPEPTAPPPTLKVTDDPTKAPPANAPKEEAPPKQAQRSDKLQRALARARLLSQAIVPEESNEGQLTGSAQGTATTAQEGDLYATQIHEAIKRNWSAPAGLVSESEIARLKVQIRVRIAPDGSLLEPTLSAPSGNALFDDSCMQAVKATGRVPPPPESSRAMFRRGVVLLFEGGSLTN